MHVCVHTPVELKYIRDAATWSFKITQNAILYQSYRVFAAGVFGFYVRSNLYLYLPAVAMPLCAKVAKIMYTLAQTMVHIAVASSPFCHSPVEHTYLPDICPSKMYA